MRLPSHHRHGAQPIVEVMTTHTPLTRPEFDPAAIVDLDVRDDLIAGREPLARILSAVTALPTNGVLHVRTTFRPAPLLTRLGRLGFQHHSESYSIDDWSTWFWRDGITASPAATVAEPAPLASDVMDLRRLAPPEPMLRIIERLERGDADFDVYLPFYPEPLVAMLTRYQCGLDLIAEGSDGVHVRVARR